MSTPHPLPSRHVGQRRLAGAATAVAILAAGCATSETGNPGVVAGIADPIASDTADVGPQSGPSDVADPATSGDRPDSIDSADPSTVASPADPGVGPVSIDPGEPSDPGDTSSPVRPADPGDPVDAPNPGEPGDPGDPADPGDRSNVEDLVVDVVGNGAIDDLIGSVNEAEKISDLVTTLDPGQLDALAPCGLVSPPGPEFASTITLDVLGDGSADDVATIHFASEWRLHLQVAGGPSSELALGGTPNPWLTVVDGLSLGAHPRQYIVVHEEAVGDDHSFNHFIGVDGDGCLQPATISLLQGFTGNWWHSLECDDGPTKYVRITWVSDDTWQLNVADILPGGSLALVADTVVAGNHPYVERLGTNNCL